MAVVLKIACQGQTQRLPFDSMPDYAMLEKYISEAVPQVAQYAIKYKDDEGDLCSLVESTFPDFITTGKATSGGEVLRVEIIPSATATADAQSFGVQKSAGLHHVTRTRKTRSFQQPQVPKPVWVSDNRDLDELVQQLEDEAIIPKLSRKKKRKARKLADEQPTAQEMQQDMQHVLEPSCETLSEKDCSVAAECYSGNNYVDEQVETDFGSSGAEHAWEVQTDFGDDDTEQMNESSGEDLEQDLEPQGKVLQRSVSCPCVSMRDDPEGVSIAQAWPFVPDDLAADMFDPLQTPVLKENASTIDAPAISTCASPGYGYSYQQVVWVPVLMDSTSACNLAAMYGMQGTDQLNFMNSDVAPVIAA
jgi:hypothetical protein